MKTKFFVILTLIMLFVMPSMVSAGSSANALSNTTSNAILVNESTDLKDGRGFAISSEMVYPALPGYFGEATPGHRFIPLAKLLAFDTVWTIEEAKSMLDGSTGSKDVQIRYLVSIGKEVASESIVTCAIKAPDKVKSPKRIAYGTIVATGKDSISADVLAKTLVAASKAGANYIQFLAEGVNREVTASGFGIGFNHTNADLKGSGNGSSGVSSGGTGYSYGKAGYVDKPWLQFAFFKVD